MMTGTYSSPESHIKTRLNKPHSPVVLAAPRNVFWPTGPGTEPSVDVVLSPQPMFFASHLVQLVFVPISSVQVGLHIPTKHSNVIT